MKKSAKLFLWCFGSFCISEAVLRLFAFGGRFIGPGLLVIPAFALAPAAILAFLCPMLGKGGKWVAFGAMMLHAVFCSAQIVYYRLFTTFFTVFSALHGGKVVDFMPIIVKTVFSLLPFILATMAVPVIFAFLGTAFWDGDKKRPLWAALGTLAGHGVFLAVLLILGTSFMSPFDLYFNTVSTAESYEELGVGCSLYVDIVRTVTGFKEDNRREPGEVTAVTADSRVIYELGDDDISAYLKTRPVTRKNDHTGIFRGKNLIFIVAESFSPYVIDPELTPTLFKMKNEGFDFTDFYTPLWGVSTTDGEYSSLLSLYPKTGTWSMLDSAENLLPFCLGNEFRALGYETNAYHDHDCTYYSRDVTHPNMGYDFYAVGSGLELTPSFPESDLELMEETVGLYAGKAPFMTYYLTVSGHMLYDFETNDMSAKNRSRTEDLPYSETVKAYIACQLELEDAMAELFERLEAAGQLESTVIALVPDHHPYVLTDAELSELRGGKAERETDIFKSEFLLYCPGYTEKCDTLACNLDVLPTLLNLFGIDYDSRLLMGRDIFGTDERLVVFSSRSFLTDEGYYISRTGETDLPRETVKRIIDEINNDFYYSSAMLEEDYYRSLSR